MDALRPGPGQPARPGDGDRRDDHPPHQDPAARLRAHHAGRRQLRRRALRPARPAVRRRRLHRGRPLRRLRRHLRRRRGHLPRRPRRPGRQARAHRRRASTSTSTSTTTTTTSPPTRSPLVGNRSAVGEQYVELQPQCRRASPSSRTAPRSPMEDTRTPIATETLLTDISDTVESVDKDALQTTVTEFGDGLRRHRRGPRSGSSTRGNVVHRGRQRQLRRHHGADPRQQHRAARASSPRRARSAPSPRRLALFSGTLAGSDQDLRARHRQRLGRRPRAAHASSRTTRSTSAELINNLVTTGEVVVKHLDGIEQVLVIYPYVVEGGFTVVVEVAGHRALRRPLRHDPHRATRRLPRGLRAHRHAGRRRTASNRPMNMNARCAEPAAAEQRPRRPERPAARRRRVPRARRGVVRPGRPASCTGATRVPRDLSSPGTLAPQTLGEESWKWLFLQPLMTSSGVTRRQRLPTTGHATRRRRAAPAAGRASGWPAGRPGRVLVAGLGVARLAAVHARRRRRRRSAATRRSSRPSARR